jgi:nucleoside-diphosphate-sugar epimerase
MSRDASPFTILGAGGFIGRALVNWLRGGDHVVHAITRASLPALLTARRPAGHVIDCIGLTGDFRTRPLDTAEAHVGVVARCLTELSFESFLYLSSTRVYAHAEATHEDTPLPCLPFDRSDTYNISKLAGEALCLSDERPRVRVARLSNVYGPGMPAETMLGEVLRQGDESGTAVFRQSSRSEKDYISLARLVRLLPALAVHGRQRLYNVASGRNTSHGEIADALRASFGWQVSFAPGAPDVRFPRIDIGRAAHEFGPPLSNLSADLATLLPLGSEGKWSRSTRSAAA